MKAIIVSLSLLLVAPAAMANPQRAAFCAARLNGSAHMIYDAAAPQVRGAPSLKRLVGAKTRALVGSGRIPRSDARHAALSAYRCLKHLE